MTDLQIAQAVSHFQNLLVAQAARAERLAERRARKAQNGPVVIGVCGGDGIGPVIMREARRALARLLRGEIAQGAVRIVDIEGLTLENRLRCGQAVPENVLDKIRDCDVLLKGPTETPSGGKMESANVTLRRELDLFANVRPICVPDQGIDWMFFRENTEGEYTLGSKGLDFPGLMAMDFKVTTTSGTRRIAKAAFDYARRNGKTHVSIVTKSNILKKTDGLFTKICHEVAAEYPGITADEYYIDIMTANILNPEIRGKFQVFLMPNLYGDILTDEAAQLQGGVGTAGSANLGEHHAMFEAIHGSAPRMIAQGLADYANPESILRAAGLLLTHIGMPDKASRLSAAMRAASRRCPVDGTRQGATCAQYGNALLDALAD